ncbi:MAG TPA: PQQ-binding-like beta-propeller repeat protein, partial [Anaerolineales bacterium]|nr:PQQ-binding-like beta-propeller repeat protein [Anaerolineales bacterium]
RLLDAFIASALSAPSLIVALAVIAALGTGQGVWVFVVGLAATGWAETARLVREQTRNIKGHLYVEAAHALGGSSLHILARHVLPQIMPLVWMLLAFEISGTLLTTAGLGFLGYYLGDVWIMITDTAAQRFSGAPELGLMLSTVTTDVYTGPWKMFAAGTMVFVTVLGFNLLGEGLRLHLDPERARRRTFISTFTTRVNAWFEERAAPTLARRGVRAALAGVLLIAVAGGALWWRTPRTSSNESRTVALSVPGGQWWATERHDPQGTLGTQAIGLMNPKVEWMFEDESGFSGGPAVSSDGVVYVAATGGTLYALDGNGQLRWTAPLPAKPVGAPALGPNGTIYVADKESGLSAFIPEGTLVWRMIPDEPTEATAGPIVSADGIIYYPMGGQVQAVSPDGEPLWRASAMPRRVSNPPALDPTGTFVFLRGGVLNAKDGSLPDFEKLPDLDQFIVGADGRTYTRFENYVTEWRMTEAGIEVMPTIDWDWRSKAWGNARDAGVTANGLIWFLYYTETEDARLVMLNQDGQVAGFYRYPHRTTEIVGFDRDSAAYICGNRAGVKAECLAFMAGAEDPLWKLSLERAGAVNGGALVPGRLYVTLENGYLYAVGE